MKKILLILLCLLLLIPSYSWAANCGGSPTIYYVDFGAANDTADGLATSTPWKHVPGDVGGSWHDSNCTLQAGDKVIFKGAVAYNSSFEVTSGSGDATANRVIYDGDSGTYATRWASGTDKAIIHGQDTREVTITGTSKNYATINSFELKNTIGVPYNGTGAVDLNSCSYITVTNCNIHTIGHFGISGTSWAAPGPQGLGIRLSASTYCKILNNTLTNVYSISIISIGGSYNEIGGNTVASCSVWGIDIASESNSSIHNNIIPNMGACYIPCVDETCSAAIHIDGMIVMNTTAHSTMSNLSIYGNLFYYDQTAPSCQLTAALFITEGGGETDYNYDGLKIYNNVFSNVWSCDGNIYLQYSNFTNTYIYNNSFNVPSSYAATSISESYGTGDNLVIKGNSIKCPGTNCLAMMLPTTGWTNLHIEYNNYDVAGQGGLYPFYYGETYTDWATWRGLGYDLNDPTNGFASDPLYTHADATHYDLSIPTGSPLKDAFPTASAPTGIFTTDYLGISRPQGSAWDIGAMEYVSGGGSTANQGCVWRGGVRK